MMKTALLIAVASLGIAGCASAPDAPKDPDKASVSVSAANYSKLSDEELRASVNADPNFHPLPPPGTVTMRPQYYLLLPGEVYDSDVPMDTVYAALEGALEPRGYFNAVFQVRAGHKPARIDYILRIHYGGRTWLTPTVRSDRITWGNDGIMSNRYMTQLASNSLFDPRVGLSPDELTGVREVFSMPKVSKTTIGHGEGPRAFTPDEITPSDAGMDAQLAKDFCLIVVEAFRFDDVKSMDKRAPCIWTTFVAVPVERGQKFSTVLPAMLKAASPYFGATTDGLQVYDVPIGKVLLGNPVEVSGPQKPQAASPAVQFRPPP
jgi:hypothetical protein